LKKPVDVIDRAEPSLLPALRSEAENWLFVFHLPKRKSISSMVGEKSETWQPSSVLDKAPMLQIILRNTAWSFISRVIHIPVSLVLIPYIVNTVGVSRYGMWVALFALVECVNLLDFGNGAATIKHVAEYCASNKKKRIGQVIYISTLFNFIYLPPLTAAVLFREEVVGVFQIESANQVEAAFLLQWVIFNFALSQLANVFRNTMIGLQKIYITNYFEIIHQFLYGIGTIVVLSQGGGLKGLIVFLFCLRVSLLAAQILYLIVVVPEVLSGFGRCDKKLWRDFLSYGVKLQVLSVSGLLNLQLDKILIGYFLRIEYVAYYDIAAKLSVLVRFIPSVLIGPIIPVSTELWVKKNKKQLEELYLQGTRYIVLLSAPAAAFFAFLAPAIIEIWMRQDVHFYASLSLRVLSVAFFFNVATGAAAAIGRGTGVLRFEMEAGIISSILNLALSVVLILLIGFTGALMGTALSMVIMNICWIFRFGNFMKINQLEFLWGIFLKPLGCACAAGLLAGPVYSLFTLMMISPRGAGLGNDLSLFAAAAVFIIVYGLGLAATRAVTGVDAERMGQMIAALRRV
jgi:O-antigen/teichoic acid export membrane protein